VGGWVFGGGGRVDMAERASKPPSGEGAASKPLNEPACAPGQLFIPGVTRVKVDALTPRHL
jgi:hypothetical protein